MYICIYFFFCCAITSTAPEACAVDDSSKATDDMEDETLAVESDLTVTITAKALLVAVMLILMGIFVALIVQQSSKWTGYGSLINLCYLRGKANFLSLITGVHAVQYYSNHGDLLTNNTCETQDAIVKEAGSSNLYSIAQTTDFNVSVGAAPAEKVIQGIMIPKSPNASMAPVGMDTDRLKKLERRMYDDGWFMASLEESVCPRPSTYENESASDGLVHCQPIIPTYHYE